MILEYYSQTTNRPFACTLSEARRCVASVGPDPAPLYRLPSQIPKSATRPSLQFQRAAVLQNSLLFSLRLGGERFAANVLSRRVRDSGRSFSEPLKVIYDVCGVHFLKALGVLELGPVVVDMTSIGRGFGAWQRRSAGPDSLEPDPVAKSKGVYLAESAGRVTAGHAPSCSTVIPHQTIDHTQL